MLCQIPSRSGRGTADLLLRSRVMASRAAAEAKKGHSVKRQEVDDRDDARQKRHEPRSKQAGTPVRGVQQPVGRRKQADIIDQRRHNRLQSRLENGLSTGKNKNRGHKADHRGMSAGQPETHHRQQDGCPPEIGPDHAAELVPTIRPSTDAQHGKKDDEGL
jgi:hypothetical protein